MCDAGSDVEFSTVYVLVTDPSFQQKHPNVVLTPVREFISFRAAAVMGTCDGIRTAVMITSTSLCE